VSILFQKKDKKEASSLIRALAKKLLVVSFAKKEKREKT